MCAGSFSFAVHYRTPESTRARYHKRIRKKRNKTKHNLPRPEQSKKIRRKEFSKMKFLLATIVAAMCTLPGMFTPTSGRQRHLRELQECHRQLTACQAVLPPSSGTFASSDEKNGTDTNNTKSSDTATRRLLSCRRQLQSCSANLPEVSSIPLPVCLVER